MNEEIIIISLGGALMVPEEVDTQFLKSFKDLIISLVAQGKKFVIITGGGKTCRKYQAFGKELNPEASKDDIDWIGIATNNLNAELLRVVFGEYAHNKVIQNLAEPFSLERPVVIGGALEPGHSSDFDAFLAAKNLGAKKVINLSNTDYVYDSDPKKNPNAEKIEQISWKNYRAMIPTEWDPGLNTPFDPIASEFAEKEGITVMTMSGKSIENIGNCLKGEKFEGTVIS